MTLHSRRIPLRDILLPSLDLVPVTPDEIFQTAGLLNRGRGLFKREPHRGAETKYRHYNRIHRDQVIYSKLFGWEGAVALVPAEFENLYVSSEFPTFEIDRSSVSLGYVRHLVRWPGLHGMMAAATNGLGQRRQRVSVDQFLALLVPVPNIEEQQVVAKLLDHLDARRTAIVERATQVRGLVTALRDSLCQVDAASVRIGDRIELVRESVPIDPDREYHPIGLRSFGRGVIHYPATCGRDLSKLRYFAVPEGALLLSNIKAWEGAIGVSSGNEVGRIASNRFLAYRAAGESVDVKYLSHFFLSRAGLPLIERASPGAADRNRTLGIKAFEDLHVPLPRIEGQRQIVSILDKAFEALRRIAYRERQLDALMESMLNRAFTAVG